MVKTLQNGYGGGATKKADRAEYILDKVNQTEQFGSILKDSNRQ